MIVDKKINKSICFEQELTNIDNKKQPDSLPSLPFLFFQEEKLRAFVDQEKKFFAYDSAPLDLWRTSQKITNTLKDRSEKGGPPLHFKNHALCCELDFIGSETLKLETPSAAAWTATLKQTPRPIFSSSTSLHLSSNKVISLQDFVKHPLFKNTLEKYSVFSFLTFFVQDPGFQQQYGDFLNHIKLENWFEPYLYNPRGLACLSLIAFLDGKINQDDLFVMHMVASSLEESSPSEPTKIVVLQESNIAEHLTSARYPPFNTSSFYTAKTQEELEEAKRTVLIHLKNKSSIQRTSITYCISNESTFPVNTVEEGIFYTTLHRIGYNEKTERHSQTIVMLSPSLCLELYQITSSLKEPPPSDHTWMFGFSHNLVSLTKGRPVSIASPLFSTPHVHEYEAGKQLGITLHDILYHLSLDWQNPHCHLFIRLGEVLLANSCQDKSIKKLAITFLDRECYLYRRQHGNLIDCFWRTLACFAAREHTDLPKSLFSLLQKAIPSEFFLDIILVIIEDYHDRSSEFPSNFLTLRFKISFLQQLTAINSNDN